MGDHDTDTKAVAALHATRFELSGREGDRQALGALLARSAQTLGALGDDPQAIASCPHCFNDASSSPDWRAVALGDFRWCNDTYFEPQKAVRRLRDSSPAANSAFDLLEELEVGGWRHQIEAALGRALDWGEVIALVCEKGEWLFGIAESNGGDGGAYRVHIDGTLTFLGVCDRIDQRIRRPGQIMHWVERERWAASVASRGFYRWDEQDTYRW